MRADGLVVSQQRFAAGESTEEGKDLGWKRRSVRQMRALSARDGDDPPPRARGNGSGCTAPAPSGRRRVTDHRLCGGRARRCKIGSSSRTPAQVPHRPHAQASGLLLQPFAAGREEIGRTIGPCVAFPAGLRQLSAVIPSRSKIPASSAEIAAFPSRKSRPV